jgi:hypothetical protein
LDQAPVARRELEVLPLVSRRAMLEGPEKFTTAVLTVESPPPAAPDFVLDAASSADGPLPPAECSSTAWPVPTTLLVQLEELTDPPACREWAEGVKDALERLSKLDDLDAAAAAAALDELKRLASEASPLAETIASPRQQSRVRSAGYALARRVGVWQSTHQMACAPLTTEIPVAARPGEMLRRLDAADAAIGYERRGGDWRRYLLTGQTRVLAEAGESADDHERRRHAQRVLRRMEWPGLTAAQERFLEREELQSLAAELRIWAAEPFDLSAILAALEAYEERPSAPLARRLAEDRLRLSWASHSQATELAGRLEEHYRNANVRAAVSQEFLTALAPEIQTSVEGVRDTIVGAAVRGRSQTTSRVAIRVLPDERRLRLLLQAEGEVATNTRSSKSGAVFLSRGEGEFHARKEIVFDGERLALGPAIAEARLSERLRSVATDYDNVPLLNVIAQSIARQGHADARSAVRRESEEKMAARVASRLDAETEARLAELEKRFAERVVKPLDRLALFAMPIELETSSSRLIARYRLAGDLQLGAHTPRPLAPADSVLSVQVHESALNNALARLSLAGRETDVAGLFREVLASLGASAQPVPDDLPENITMQLADDEPVRVDLLDGQVRVTVRLHYLKTDSRTWRNIASRAYYAPHTGGLNARLVRTGAVELTGEHLRMRDQLALRAIFCKVFTERRALELIPARIARFERLQSLEVSQLVVRDGWLGFALSRRRAEGAVPATYSAFFGTATR